MSLIGFYKQKVLSRFNDKVMFWIEDGQRGNFTFCTIIDHYKIKVEIEIDRIVFVKWVSVSDRLNNSCEDKYLFELLRNMAMTKLTGRLEVIDFLRQNKNEYQLQEQYS